MSLARVVLHILISFILGFMALCLKSSQKHFLDTKGSDLWSAICEGDAHRVPPPCHIKLATSEVDQECLLLILDGNTGQELSPSHHHASGSREGLGGVSVGHQFSLAAWEELFLLGFCFSHGVAPGEVKGFMAPGLLMLMLTAV